MKALAYVLALVFFVLGILYGMGKIEFLTRSGTAHPSHVSHLILCWVIALLCLIWARFQGAPARR